MYRPKQKPKRQPFVSTLTALALLVVYLLSGCATQSPPLQPPPVQTVRLQPLPSYAKQPPPPPDCSVTCMTNLTASRESMQKKLTGAALPAGPANESTKKP